MWTTSCDRRTPSMERAARPSPSPSLAGRRRPPVHRVRAQRPACAPPSTSRQPCRACTMAFSADLTYPASAPRLGARGSRLAITNPQQVCGAPDMASRTPVRGEGVRDERRALGVPVREERATQGAARARAPRSREAKRPSRASREIPEQLARCDRCAAARRRGWRHAAKRMTSVAFDRASRSPPSSRAPRPPS